MSGDSTPHSGCPGRTRHWFTLKAAWTGSTGNRSPVCIFCLAPNPQEMTSDDWQVALECTPRLLERAGFNLDILRDQIEDMRERGYGD